MDNGLLLPERSSYSPSRWVLILIVMDNGLLPKKAEADYVLSLSVLILIVMDNGLLRLFRLLRGRQEGRS